MKRYPRNRACRPSRETMPQMRGGWFMGGPQCGGWCARRRDWRGLARGGEARRWRRWNFCKDFLIGGLQFGDLAHHLVLTGGKLLDACPYVGKLPLDGLSHRDDTRFYLLYLVQIGRRRSGRFRSALDCLRRGQLNSGACGTSRGRHPAEPLDPARDHLLGLRRPAKFRGSCRDYLLCCLAVRLPSQDRCNTNANGDQITGEPSRASPFHLAFYCCETIINCLSLRGLLVEVMIDRQKQVI